MTASVSREHVVEDVDRLGLLDLRDHVRVRARLLDQRAQLAHVVGRAHERQRDEVDAELERELEVVDVLRRQRRDRERDAGEVHALVRADRAADDRPRSARAPPDALDAQPHEPVVDQDVVPGWSTSPITAGATGSSPSGATLLARR